MKKTIALFLFVFTLNAYANDEVENNEIIEADSGRYAWSLLDNKDFTKNFEETLKKSNVPKSEKWLYTLSGPSSPSSNIVIGDEEEWTLFNICKAHDCADNISLFIMNTDGNIKGVIHQNTGYSFYGNPTDEESSILKHYLQNNLY